MSRHSFQFLTTDSIKKEVVKIKMKASKPRYPIPGGIGAVGRKYIPFILGLAAYFGD
jgi:hypothetical protein